ncbi:MAG: DNA cytosine methyltransferase [Deltaproteobacteria bacterium]|nr:DNA cytosine methyltransferase [Deltaproteobacteria bacterium]
MQQLMLATEKSLTKSPLIIDSFAGGGGASTGIEAALGRPVDVAINHDEIALAMHEANHPGTLHDHEDMWKADPLEITGGRPVGLMWASPDCTHHSKARGGKPVKKEIRGMAWTILRWAAKTRPAVLVVENVEEFQGWGPLTRSNRPCKKRKGMTFDQWVRQLRALGYDVEWKELRACDYGSPTIRKRLFIIARSDGQAIVWPPATHGPGLIPYRTAAEIIDWSIPCPSIFERKRPLADATLRRIALGIKRFVIEAEEPFIVGTANTKTTGRGKYVWSTTEPLRTQTSTPDKALVVPYITPYYGPKSQNENRAKGVDQPLPTQTSENRFGLVTAFLAKHFGGAVGVGADKPLPTILSKGCQTQVVTSNLVKLRGTCKDGQPVTEPLPTLTGGGNHVAEVRAFLLKYYGTAIGQSATEPLHSLTAKARFGLVTIHGEPWQIVDIGMRMLTPRELFRAQGFPENYHIGDFTKAAQVRLVGNSVCPQVAEAIVRANCKEASE